MLGVQVVIHYNTSSVSALLMSQAKAADWIADTLPVLIREHGISPATRIEIRFYM